MKDCTYYDLLGVPKDATDEQIVAAKNFLAKKFHPDANIDSKFDTTAYFQNVLHAYRILSDPKKRRAYDRHLENPAPRERKQKRSQPQQYAPETVTLSPNFAPYWEAANKLNELTGISSALFKQKKWGKHDLPEDTLQQLQKIAKEAAAHITVLESANIPREYWFSHAMNWILFQWSQHRELSYEILYAMYDGYLEQRKSALDQKKIQLKRNMFLNRLDKIMEFQI